MKPWVQVTKNDPIGADWGSTMSALGLRQSRNRRTKRGAYAYADHFARISIYPAERRAMADCRAAVLELRGMTFQMPSARRYGT